MASRVNRPRMGEALGTRNEATRRHNLSSLLTLVHHADGLSRADLTRATGLNRSTIGALVGDLVEAGFVTEEHPETTGVGRPSPVVRARRDVVALAVYPDLDAVSLALVSLGHRLVARERIELPEAPSPAMVVELATEAVAGWVEEGSPRLVGAGVAVPGLVRAEDGLVVRAPHLAWQDEPLGAELSEALDVPVDVDNDANAGLIAESLYGAGRGVSHLIYLNGSTSGIGGAVGIDGAVLRGADGFAGELGHILADPDGRACHCGRQGCLETEVNLQRLEEAAGGALDHAALEESLGSSPAVEEELTRQARVLARGIANVTSVFNPRTVILGGFLGLILDRRPDVIHDLVERHTYAPLAQGLTLTRAALVEDQVLVGAGELAFRSLLADPLGDL